MVAPEACLVVLREMPIAMRVVAMLGVLVWQQIGTFCANVRNTHAERLMVEVGD